ncbi:uncharacterized protein with HEPN domain [Thermosporothrix hazakensis]|jgi:uncharacterized protein with HEPN domain|uniref:Uncharacterized protein with HEPN domain n=1 Tax=Thermosporothrix hazakensis TaxID=644383 RepID=A0A326U5N4_THEHA|nr:DUF86 domain-containing protein [Thermosporothrix hazakensis]PZW21098.1 uncharacterized protein with HEPN domain [Thermosporothrix hazakensis]GCE50735.1 DUF86 domain-containing protein [Thermosporothrix hazakensis]
MRDTRERFQDMYEAILRSEKYAQQGRTAFEQNELIQTWIIHHLEIIGEAARAIPQDERASHPHIPWKEISGMRNILIHMYFGIDTDLVWNVVEHDLPRLKTILQALLTLP